MGSKPLLLDLFCGAGGAAMGYHRAGFDVVGVDIKPQPHYPFTFYQDDSLAFLDYPRFWTWKWDAIHASPPCQAYSTTKSLHRNEHPDLVSIVRELLIATGLPYVIENVPGAPLRNAVMICGSGLDLGVRRHRLFESNRAFMGVPCAHPWQLEPVDVTGLGGPGGRHRKPTDLAHGQEVMGINWMTRAELSQAIPPAYTEFLGSQLIEQLGRVA